MCYIIRRLNLLHCFAFRRRETAEIRACQLSYEKISTLFADLFGYDLNESTAISNNEIANERLEATEERIKEALKGNR